MKNIIGLLAAVFFLSSFSLQAQRVRPTLDIVLSDNNPLQIIVNGRVFPNVNNKISIKDLPARNNTIEVIRYCTNDDGQDCKKKMVFSGRVPMKYNKNYQAVVLIGEGKLRVSDDGTLLQPTVPSNITVPPVRPNYPPREAINQPANTPNAAVSSEFNTTATLKAAADQRLKNLGDEIKKLDRDEDRIAKAINYIKSNNNNNTVADIQVISSWIMFDANKLSFVKQAYPFVKNQRDYASLNPIFTMKSYADEFDAFVAAQPK